MRDVQADRLERLNEFVRRMNEVERDLSHPVVRPKDAATLILVDRSAGCRRCCSANASTPQVHARQVRLSRRRRRPVRQAHAVRDRSSRTPKRPAAALPTCERRPARALALAAVRETFEETGILLGSDARGGERTGRAVVRVCRSQVLPDLRNIHFIGRAITPPGRPRRFDARFFTMDAARSRIASTASPAPTPNWSNWSGCRSPDAKQLDMPAVTGVMLEELDARIADGFGHDLPVPFYRMMRGTFAMRELL